jgi:hypothetical protein
MRLFRSEEHLERWLASGDHPRGERMPVAQQWQLAQTWFAGRDRPEWRKRSAPEAEAVFAGAGLTGDFWRLA